MSNIRAIIRKHDKSGVKSKNKLKISNKIAPICSLRNVLLLVVLLFVLSIYALGYNYDIESINMNMTNARGNLKGSFFKNNLNLNPDLNPDTNQRDFEIIDIEKNLGIVGVDINTVVNSVQQQPQPPPSTKIHPIEISNKMKSNTNHANNANHANQYNNAVKEMKKQQANVVRVLKGHLINRVGIDNIVHRYTTIEDLLHAIFSQPQCGHLPSGVTIPVFTAMASVQSDIYWQLSQNFMYSMVQFNISDCAVMICVSDAGCMRRCKDSSFPCYAYEYKNVYKEIDSSTVLRQHVKNRQAIEKKKEKKKFGSRGRSGIGIGSGSGGDTDSGVGGDKRRTTVTPMEQIANLKLFHLPKALALGVDLFILDLDVGFINNPMDMISAVTATRPDVDIFVQVRCRCGRSRCGCDVWM